MLMPVFRGGMGNRSGQAGGDGNRTADFFRRALLENRALKERIGMEANARVKRAVERLIEERSSLHDVVTRFFEEKREGTEKLFGIKLLPLMRMNEPAKVREAFERFVAEVGIEPCSPGKVLLSVVNEVYDKNLLGNRTRMKLNDRVLRVTGGFDENNGRIWGRGKTVKELGPDDMAAHRKALCRTVADLIKTHAHRIGGAGELQRLLKRMMEAERFFELVEERVYKGINRAVLESDAFWEACVDAMASVLGECAREGMLGEKAPEILEGVRCTAGKGIETEFALRNSNFIRLGDITGDCTASNKVKQLDQETPNIFPTVYAWIIDAWYQILLVRYRRSDNDRGRIVMKAHILPLEIDGEVALAIDGIEAIPQTRNELRCADPELVGMRDAFFNSAVEKVLEIADAMGIVNVVADLYSNAPWLREALRRYPERFVEIKGVHKLDDLPEKDGGRNAYVNELASELTGERERVFYEVQFQDDSLLYDAKDGWKNFALIRGNVGSEKKVLRQV